MPNDDAFYRRRVSKQVGDLVDQAFPGVDFNDAINRLLEVHRNTSADPIACAQTELWIKIQRLEEAVALLALSNIEIGEWYRRIVAGELVSLQKSSTALATAALAFHQQTNPKP